MTIEARPITIALALALQAAAFLTACGSSGAREWMRIKELTSNCDGGLKVRVMHVPDPYNPRLRISHASLKLPEADKIAFLRDDNVNVHVGLTSGIVCRFLGNDEEGRCTKSWSSDAEAGCSARLKMVGPSIPDDVFRQPKI